MDEIFARRDLIEPALLHVLSARSNRAGFLQLGSHICAIFATGVALYATLGTYGLCRFSLLTAYSATSSMLPSMR